MPNHLSFLSLYTSYSLYSTLFVCTLILMLCGQKHAYMDVSTRLYTYTTYGAWLHLSIYFCSQFYSLFFRFLIFLCFFFGFVVVVTLRRQCAVPISSTDITREYLPEYIFHSTWCAQYINTQREKETQTLTNNFYFIFFLL